MTLYLLVPLVSCVVCAVLATAIFTRDSQLLAHRLAGALVTCAGVWAGCQVLWNAQTDADDALRLVRLASIGWAWIAPLSVHLFLELTGEPYGRAGRVLPLLYALAALVIPLDCFTGWLHPEVVRTAWGWSYRLGWAYPVFYGFIVGCVVVALWIGWDAIRRIGSSGERVQARWVSAGATLVLVLGSATDGILPMLDVHVPQLGTASWAVLGGMTLWSFQRFGYSLLAPGTFASEILETLPDGVAMLRIDGQVRNANRAMGELLDAGRERLVGLRITDHLSEPIHPTADAMERRCELTTLRGRRRPVAISSALLRDRQGALIGVVLVMRDLAEVVSLHDRLVLSARLAAVGELAAGIAHEINNPLAFVRANLGMLRQHWSEIGAELEKAGLRRRLEDELREGEDLIGESLEGVDRAGAIVRDVRGLAHGGSRERRAADLNELLDGVMRIARPQLGGRIRVEREIAELPPVWCAPQELQQVFLNLVLNAVQAIGGEGRIAISTQVRGEQVIVTVEDDGCGIDPEIRDRIFDPFFTTKAVGEGSGLGLGIAHGIVRSHGGDIVVDSTPGQGSRFSVHLPLVADTIDAPRA